MSTLEASVGEPPPPDLQQRLTGIAQGFAGGAQSLRILEGYLHHLQGHGPVLDVGCGDGRMLDLLQARGLDAVGVERCLAPLERARHAGHRVEQGEALSVVQELTRRGERFGAAVLSQVVEHMAPVDVLALLDALHGALKPGAPLLVATPNPRNLVVLEQLFWLDPTHVRPYPRLLLEHMGRDAGFSVAASYDDPMSVPARSWWKRCLAKVRSLWSGADRSGPMDSVVVLRREP